MNQHMDVICGRIKLLEFTIVHSMNLHVMCLCINKLIRWNVVIFDGKLLSKHTWKWSY